MFLPWIMHDDVDLKDPREIFVKDTCNRAEKCVPREFKPGRDPGDQLSPTEPMPKALPAPFP